MQLAQPISQDTSQQSPETIKLYHCTKSKATALQIIREGFRDNDCRGEAECCYFSNWPKRRFGDFVVEVQFELTVHDMFYLYESVLDEGTYRQFLIPAEVVNQFPRRLMTKKEADSLENMDQPNPWDKYPPGEPRRTLALLDEDEVDAC